MSSLPKLLRDTASDLMGFLIELPGIAKPLRNARSYLMGLLRKHRRSFLICHESS